MNFTKWLPHSQGDQFDAGAFFLAQRFEKQVDVSLIASPTQKGRARSTSLTIML